jgi:hypothetical protein
LSFHLFVLWVRDEGISMATGGFEIDDTNPGLFDRSGNTLYPHDIRARVRKAQEIQDRRFWFQRGVFVSADMQPANLREYCRIDAARESLRRNAITKIGLSARAYNRILKVACTIADLAGSEAIGPAHVGEAVQYRSLDWDVFVQTGGFLRRPLSSSRVGIQIVVHRCLTKQLLFGQQMVLKNSTTLSCLLFPYDRAAAPHVHHA